VGQDFSEALSLCHGSILHIPHYFRPNYTTHVLRRKNEVKKKVLKKRPRHQITITEKQADNIAVNLVSIVMNKQRPQYNIKCFS